MRGEISDANRDENLDFDEKSAVASRWSLAVRGLGAPLLAVGFRCVRSLAFTQD